MRDFFSVSINYGSSKLLCPLWKHELELARDFGSKVFLHNPMKSDYKTNFWVPLYENRECVWFFAPDLKRHQYDW
jgi:hypothetical protein